MREKLFRLLFDTKSRQRKKMKTMCRMLKQKVTLGLYLNLWMGGEVLKIRSVSRSIVWYRSLENSNFTLRVNEGRTLFDVKGWWTCKHFWDYITCEQKISTFSAASILLKFYWKNMKQMTNLPRKKRETPTTIFLLGSFLLIVFRNLPCAFMLLVGCKECARATAVLQILFEGVECSECLHKLKLKFMSHCSARGLP